MGHDSHGSLALVAYHTCSSYLQVIVLDWQRQNLLERVTGLLGHCQGFSHAFINAIARYTIMLRTLKPTTNPLHGKAQFERKFNEPLKDVTCMLPNRSMPTAEELVLATHHARSTPGIYPSARML